MTMERPLLLVADPDPFSGVAAEMLLGLQYKVVCATTAEDAIASVRRHRPAAILSELFLEDDTCLGLRGRLDSEPVARGIPLVILTNLPALARQQNPECECVDKRFLSAELVRALERSIGRFRPVPSSSTLSFLLERGREIIVRDHGLGGQIERTNAPPWDDCVACAELFQSAVGQRWASVLDDCGTRLLALLEQSCGLQSRRASALAVLGDSPLRLEFVGAAESLQIPLETLINPEERKPLVTQHRFARFLLRPGGNRHRVFRSGFLTGRAEDLRTVRWLVIGFAQDPENDVHRIADELHHAMRFTSLLSRKGVKVVHQVVPPSEASLERIQHEIQSPEEWHIVHIAGHCPTPHPDADNGIRFSSPAAGGVQILTPKAFAEFLAPKPPDFVFLNCCHGTEVYGEALAGCGTGGFLTFRGMHAAGDFVHFAREFYEALADYGDLETAAQTARSSVFEALPNSGIWAAASLVLQNL